MPELIIFSGVNKLLFSVMVDNLISKTLAWEDEKKKLFLYDGVSYLKNLKQVQV